jgi:hypothetical protein
MPPLGEGNPFAPGLLTFSHLSPRQQKGFKRDIPRPRTVTIQVSLSDSPQQNIQRKRHSKKYHSN